MPRSDGARLCAKTAAVASRGRRAHALFGKRLSENMGPVADNTDVIFDSVVTNVGRAYDPDTGKFAAPADGVYQFNVVISAQGRQKVRSDSSHITSSGYVNYFRQRNAPSQLYRHERKEVKSSSR